MKKNLSNRKNRMKSIVAMFLALSMMSVFALNALADGGMEASETELFAEVAENPAAEELGQTDADEQPAAETCVVTLYDKDGNYLSKATVVKGESIKRPRAPELDGYRFVHWYLVNHKSEGDVEKVFDFATIIEADLFLRALYIEEEMEAQSETPAQNEEPVASEEPVAVEEPVASEGPVAVKEPVASEEPVATEEPVASEEPVATEEPVASEEPVATEEPIASEEPVATEEPIASEEPVATEEPIATEEPAVEDPEVYIEETLTSPVVEESVVEETVVEESVAEEPVVEDTEVYVEDTEVYIEETLNQPTGESIVGESTTEEPTLISETEVTSFMVRFYGEDNAELYRFVAEKGDLISPYAEAPVLEGREFSHWYVVNAQLLGNPEIPYNFAMPVNGLVYLKAHYVAANDVQEEAAEDASVVVPAEVGVNIEVNLQLIGREPMDGEFFAALLGPNVIEGGQVIANTGSSFRFAGLVFGPEDVGVWEYVVRPVIPAEEAQLPYVTYFEHDYIVVVTVALDENGQVTAKVVYPNAGEAVNIIHNYNEFPPTARLYANVEAGQLLEEGQPITLYVETVNCGETPIIQWQYSHDNINWMDVEGATDTSYTFELTQSNFNFYWRAGIIITD
jgi:hypothetical protein